MLEQLIVAGAVLIFVGSVALLHLRAPTTQPDS